MKLKLLVIAAAIAIGVGVGGLYMREHRPPAEPVAGLEPATTSPTTTRPPVSPPPAAAAEPAIPAPAAGETPREQVNRLSKSSDPKDAFDAFRVLYRCEQLNECADLDAGQRTTIYPLLLRAVAAHVPGSAVYLVSVTPDGREIGEVWDDPAYADWKRNAYQEIQAAADRGDPAAMRQMVHTAWLDKRPETALAYFTAYADRQPPTYKVFNDYMTKVYSDGLPPEKVAAAIARGHTIGGQK